MQATQFAVRVSRALCLGKLVRSSACLHVVQLAMHRHRWSASWGIQHFVFIDQQTHAMRLAWYRAEYERTPEGWRIWRRATTFLGKHGGFDSGRQHDNAGKGTGPDDQGD
jgi:hypothetical protein